MNQGRRPRVGACSPRNHPELHKHKDPPLAALATTPTNTQEQESPPMPQDQLTFEHAISLAQGKHREAITQTPPSARD
jgi:hypothetical protein